MRSRIEERLKFVPVPDGSLFDGLIEPTWGGPGSRPDTYNTAGFTAYERVLWSIHVTHRSPLMLAIERKLGLDRATIESSVREGLARGHLQPGRAWPHGAYRGEFSLTGDGFGFIVPRKRRAISAHATRDDWARFDARVAIAPSGCWEYRAPRNAAGYGRIVIHGLGAMAHRVNYERILGPIPDNLVLDHLCRNPPCVNPDHLEAVTCAENVRRGAASRRAVKPITCGPVCVKSGGLA